MINRRSNTRRRTLRWLAIGGTAAILLTAAMVVIFVIKPWQAGDEAEPDTAPVAGATPPAADSCEAQGVEYVLIDGVAYDPQTSTIITACVPALTSPTAPKEPPCAP